MYIDQDLWPALKDYIFSDRKLRYSKHNEQVELSRFRAIVSFFLKNNLSFSRSNFTKFIADKQNYGNSRSGKKYANNTLNNYIKTAKHIARYFGSREFDDYTFFEKKIKVDVNIISPDNIRKLSSLDLPYVRMGKFINQRQKTLLLFQATTGCRINEALSLLWKDVEDYPPHVLFRDTKNGEDRIVPIGKEIYELLQSLPRKSDLVFCSRTGQKLLQSDVNKDYQARAKQLGLPRFTTHDLRYSYITTTQESGMDSLDVAHLVGHKDPKTTMGYKRSNLAYYSSIIYQHPLLQKENSIMDVSERVASLAKRMVNKDVFSIYIQEHEEGKVCVTIQKQLTR